MKSLDVSRELYPFKGNFLNIDGLDYHYLDEGDGEPIVMVHGNPTWSFYFRSLVKGLGPRYRKIVPDHIGCGMSSKPLAGEYGFRLSDRVENLGRLIDSLDLKEKITLVLHDWGGMIGMTWARQNPERIKRLIILNTSGFHLPKTKKLPPTIGICRNTKIGSALVTRVNAFTRAANHLCTTHKKLSQDVKSGYLAPHPHRQDRLAILRFVQDIPLKPGDPSYEVVSETQEKLKLFSKTPTLILWGAKDFVFDDHFLAEWLKYLPQAEVHRFPNAGHYILEDMPDECLELINGFLTRTIDDIH